MTHQAHSHRISNHIQTNTLPSKNSSRPSDPTSSARICRTPQKNPTMFLPLILKPLWKDLQNTIISYFPWFLKKLVIVTSSLWLVSMNKDSNLLERDFLHISPLKSCIKVLVWLKFIDWGFRTDIGPFIWLAATLLRIKRTDATSLCPWKVV